MKPKIVIALNTSWNLVNFRTGLISSMLNAGYDVIALAPRDEFSERLVQMGCTFIHIPIDNQGTHPVKDFLLCYRFYKVLRQVRPVIFLGYTVKPNIYGSLAAHLLQIPVINNIAGLGAAFINQTWLTVVVRALYRLALARSAKVFFQNNDDKQLFILDGLVKEQQTGLLPGSGIDLNKFTPVPPSNREPLRFLLIARMLWDKGIGEFVGAARILRNAGIEAEFCLVGFLDVQNPTAISRAQMDEWESEGIVQYLGESHDIRQVIAQADCIVLPSYREGTPRVLLEAAAMAKPIITTDAVGCREVLDDGVNGYLCRPRDAKDLAEKLIKMLSLSDSERQKMGESGRRKMEREFDEQLVINEYLASISAQTQKNY